MQSIKWLLFNIVVFLVISGMTEAINKGCNKRKVAGCYKDEPFVDTVRQDGSKFSKRECRKRCQDAQYAYSATQGQICKCGNELVAINKIKRKECKCENGKNRCGLSDKNTNFVFRLPCNPIVGKCDALTRCKISGDPHYKTFDGEFFDFQGACVYNAITVCDDDNTVEDFKIRTTNERRGDASVSRIKTVEYIMYCEHSVTRTYEFNRDTKDYKKDGVLMTGAHIDKPCKTNIHQDGDSINVHSESGVSFTFEKTTLTVDLCDRYINKICNGLCGNNNGDKTDDFIGFTIDPNEPKNTRHYKFGDSFKSDKAHQKDRIDVNDQRCDNFTTGNPPPPPKDCDQELYEDEVSMFCGQIMNKEGPFAQCIEKLTLQQEEEQKAMYQDCLVDYCASNDKKSARCGALGVFNQFCMDNHGEISDEWRSDGDCELTCTGNEVLGVKNFEPTCAERTNPNPNSPMSDDCHCKENFVRNSKGLCVAESECGCVDDDGNMMSVGEVKVNEDCTKVLECITSGEKPEEKNTELDCNGDGKKCVLNEETKTAECQCAAFYEGDGQTCEPVCNEGFLWCYGFGDPHYKNSADYKFDMNNTCSYILAEVKLEFKVSVVHIQTDDNLLTYMKEIHIEDLYSGVEHIIVGKKLFKLDDDDVTRIDRTGDLPIQNEYFGGDPNSDQPRKFNAYQTEYYTVFETALYTLYFDGHMLFKIKICNVGDCTRASLCYVLTGRQKNIWAKEWPWKGIQNSELNDGLNSNLCKMP